MFEVLHVFVYVVVIALAGIASYLMYSGLTTEEDTIIGKLQFKQSMGSIRKTFTEGMEESELEKKLNKAGNPLGLTATKYVLVYYGILFITAFAYILTPVMKGNGLNIYAILALVVLIVGLNPDIKFSGFNYGLSKLMEMQQIKLQSEVFMLYDLILGEVRMMQYGRVNTFSIIRQLVPEFKLLRPSLSLLLINWNRDGQDVALNAWAEQVGVKEASSLASVLKELDNNDINVALNALESQQKMFLTQNIETFRSRIKIKADVSNLPIKLTFGLIMANFLANVIYMSLGLMNTSTIM